MPDITLTTLLEHKARGEKIAMLTCYDATFAAASCDAGIEMLLVGDSLGMVLQGRDSTLPVTIEDMAYHTACVKRGNKGAMIVADLPFMGTATLEEIYRQSATSCAPAPTWSAGRRRLLCEAVTGLAQRGIPACIHLGLTPQSVNIFGGYRVQGREAAAAAQLKADAQALEQAGAAMLLLECVPSSLAAEVTTASKVPVIGIGAGPSTDGQVLVLHDMLGMSLTGFTPRFVRNFMQGSASIGDALAAYQAAVKDGSFPAPAHEFNA